MKWIIPIRGSTPGVPAWRSHCTDRTILREAAEYNQTFLYDEKREGGTISFGRPSGKNLKYFLTLRADTIYATNDNDDVVPSILLQQSTVRSITLSQVYDSREPDMLNPTSGTYTNVAAEFAGLGGARFNKYTADLRHYWQLESRRRRRPPAPGSHEKPHTPVVFASRVMAGLTGDETPFLDQFLLGGAETLRGYAEDRFPGERLVLWNNELRVPLAESLQGVLFIDVGDAWQGTYSAQFGDSNYDLHYGYGLGVRVVTPIGLLRFDYGFNDEGGHQFHFGLNAAF